MIGSGLTSGSSTNTSAGSCGNAAASITRWRWLREVRRQRLERALEGEIGDPAIDAVGGRRDVSDLGDEGEVPPGA